MQKECKVRKMHKVCKVNIVHKVRKMHKVCKVHKVGKMHKVCKVNIVHKVHKVRKVRKVHKVRKERRCPAPVCTAAAAAAGCQPAGIKIYTSCPPSGDIQLNKSTERERGGEGVWGGGEPHWPRGGDGGGGGKLGFHTVGTQPGFDRNTAGLQLRACRWTRKIVNGKF